MPKVLASFLAGLAGFVGAGLMWTLPMWDEVFRRFSYASSGGAGETADWGQPLFFIVIMGFVPGCVGALLLSGLTLLLLREQPDEP